MKKHYEWSFRSANRSSVEAEKRTQVELRSPRPSSDDWRELDLHELNLIG
jgi:hypothetical protein